MEVVDGTVFVPRRGVFALDQETGEKLWRSEERGYHGGDVLSSPAVSQGTVYLGNGSRVAAFNSAVGKLRWAEGPNPRGKMSPVVVDGTVYAAGGYRTVYAYDAETGDEEWLFDEVEQPFLTSPTVADGTLFVCTVGFMYALDTDSGQERLRYNPDWGILSSPTVADGTVYVGGESYEGDGGIVAAFDTAEDTERWRFERLGEVRSSPTVAGNTLFVGSDDGALYALNVADGSERWRFETGAEIRTAPIVVDGTVYVADTDGTVYALDARVHGSSVDSRVLLGAQGHHHAWAEAASTDVAPAEFVVELNAVPNPVVTGDEITVQITVTNVGDEVGRRTLHFDAAATDGDENGLRQIHFDGQDSFEEPIELTDGESETIEASGTVKRGPAKSTVPAPEWPGELSLAARVYEDATELTIPVEKPANDQEDGHLSDYWPVGALGALGGAGYLLNRRRSTERK
ncbi:PQQ-binding-like beta-propeller repeat protein [Halovivax cerinus]|uniref:outer membrane protein assembly factor BamB family protein n=1 Tax=Halovivax cerinus TaxID=1487865 RepID=UPI003CCD674D